MTRRKKIVIEIAVVFFVVLGLLTYFADEIDFMLLPQVKTCEPILNYSHGKFGAYSLLDCYIPKSSVIFDGESAIVYAINEYYGDDENKLQVVYPIDIIDDIKGSDEVYYTVSVRDSMMTSVTATTQLVYYTSKPLSDGDRVFITEEN